LKSIRETPKAKWLLPAVLFLASQTVSMFGSMLVSFAITWELTLSTSSGKVMMISVLCSCLPQVLISPLGGVWADRYNRKVLIIASDLFIAVATLVLAYFLFSGYEALWLVYLVLTVRSAGQGIQSPAVQAIVPQMVPQQQLTRFNGITSTLQSIISLAAPAAGGLILSALGFTWSLLVDATTAILAIVIMLFLRVQPYERKQASLTLFHDLKEGMLYVKRDAVISTVLKFFGAYILLLTPAIFLTPLLVERTFGSEVWRLTANELSWSIGTLAGGAFVSIWGGWKNKIVTMSFGALWFGLMFGLMGIAGNFTFYLALMVVAGLFMPLMATASTVLIQETTEPMFMGRVFSLWSMISNLVAPAGMLVYGPLADRIPVQWIMVGSGALLAALGVWLLGKRSLAASEAPGNAAPYHPTGEDAAGSPSVLPDEGSGL